MKWVPKDIDTYLTAKEYVDTAIIPLYSLALDDSIKSSAEAAEFISLLSGHLERQFTGRLVLLPSFTYLKNEDTDFVINQLKKWEDNIKTGFKHIFYITSESEWKLNEQSLSGTVVWLPAIPLESIGDSQKLSIIDSQVKQLLSLFTQKWHENS